MKTAPDPKDVQEFLFKQSSISQVLNAFTSIPVACSLLVTDKKRGLLYIGHDNKIIVLKPGEDSDPEWMLQLDLPIAVSKLMLSCDCSYLAIAPHRPFVLIYDAQALTTNNLQLLYEIRISSINTEAFVNDLKWNPTVPGMLCTVASDYTVGSFQIKEDKEKTIGLKALERLNGLDILCAAWSPKGKQIVVGCKNGNLVQLKPDLKVARTITGPTPYIGEVITILWISNYQFCAAYLGNEQHINVLIVDAPKGETNAIFTCYEDITYGIPDAEGAGCIPRYYFDHVPEWGVIIAASSGSSEIAVLGSADGGTTWSQWQLVDSGRAQLPLICTTESYPVGLAIDRSPTRNLPWGAESTLPHPVPLLHILGTSGQLCSFHMVNLTPNCPAINSPPTEIIASPPQLCQNIAPSETSMSINNMVTSTPMPKPVDNKSERSKPAPVRNIFGDSLKVAGFFQQPEIEKPKPQEQKPVAVPISIPVPVPVPVPVPMAKVEPVKQTHSHEAAKPEIKIALVKETIAQVSAEQKATIDDSICVRAFLEEQNLFQKELRNKLEPQTWECGTEDERKQLVDGVAVIDQFLRDLRETTNSLSNDIAYLKALLLQSFAWVEETKSKNAATVDINPRSFGDSSKISDLQRLYYYTQTQLTQATKILDLEWSDHKSRENTRMKIPSMEFIYQNLVMHIKIIDKEKSKIQQLKKHWNSVARTNSTSGLNRSISNLRITSPKSTSSLRGDAGIIEARCKAIASKTLSFTQEKQNKLKDLLFSSTPKIIKPVNPSPVQDRLEATLSSLASLTSTTTGVKSKTEPPVVKQSPITKQTGEKAKQQSPLASLNSIVARIGSTESNGTQAQGKTQTKLPSVSTSFPAIPRNKLPQPEKKSTPVITTPTVPQVKPKQDGILFGQLNSTAHASPGLAKVFPKVDGVQEILLQKSLPKEGNKTGKESLPINDSPKPETNLFSANTLKDALSSEISVGKLQPTSHNVSLASVMMTPTIPATKTDAMTTFSFANPSIVSTISKTISQDTLTSSQATSAQTFSFALKPSGNVQSTPKILPPTTAPQAQGALDLTGLTLGLQTSNQAQSQLTRKLNGIEMYHQKSTSLTSALGTVSTVNEISISLVSGVPINDTTTTTSSVTIEEVPSNDSQAPSITGNIMQALPATLATPLFGGQPSNLSIPLFKGISTSTLTTPTYSVPTTISSPSIFGGQNTTSTVPVFGGFSNATSTAATISTTASATAAASPFYTSLSKPTFGEAPPTSSVPNSTDVNNSVSTALPFGSIATTSMTPVFGKATMSPLATNNQFPTPVASTANAFGKPVINNSSMLFGTPSNTSVFGNMPASSPTTSIFGGNNTISIFGATSPSSSTGSMFGGTSASTATFGTPTKSIFENNAQKPSSVFNTPTNTESTSFFGGAASAMSVGGPSAGSPSVFGGVGNSASPMAVGGQAVLGSPSGFGQTSTFGSKPVFGSPPAFGATMSVFGSGFGQTAFGASPTPPAFGSPPAMPGNPPPMESNMPKVFGNAEATNTFESLASQSGGLSFSSLAQKGPEPEKPPVFAGGSSFSSWR